MRIRFIKKKISDGSDKGKLSFYCSALNVSRQAYYKHLKSNNLPWKYQDVADLIKKVLDEDECNDKYGRIRIHQALQLSAPKGMLVPGERTIYRIMKKMGINKSKRKPKGLTKADKEAQKSDDLIKRDFRSEAPLKKWVTDITKIKGKDGKLYVSAIFDCYDLCVLGLAMDTNMKAPLCVKTLSNACRAYPGLKGSIGHSDRGTQYTSEKYRESIKKYGIKQSMNSAGGRCHDNARCESMWARMKEELFYGRYKTENIKVSELKTMVWRYYMSYWNNRRICSANGGLPPIIKRKRYYQNMEHSACA